MTTNEYDDSILKSDITIRFFSSIIKMNIVKIFFHVLFEGKSYIILPVA